VKQNKLAFYNETDPYCCAWLSNLMDAGLIMPGMICGKSIAEVTPDDISGFVRCHFFAGLAGWDLALQLAGWPADRPVWTGSCPCQPFSAAGKRKGNADARHLWPEMRRLIAAIGPSVVFGEQVSGAPGYGWLDGVFADLEGEGYTCGALDIPAGGIGAPHIRNRLWWVADTSEQRRQQDAGSSFAHEGENGRQSNGYHESSGNGSSGGLGHSSGGGQWRAGESGQELRQSSQIGRSGSRGTGGLEYSQHPDRWPLDHPRGDDSRDLLSQRQESASGAGSAGEDGWVADTEHAERRAELQEHPDACGRNGSGRSRNPGPWGDYALIPCRDGKSRRVKSGLQCLAHGTPARVAKLRAIGNAIVPPLAAEFVRTYMERLY